jgi:type VI secretion system secreted protein VgrG
MAMALGNSRSNEAGTPTAPTQDGHLLAIETPLGKDVLLLTALDGTETVSRGFVYTIEMLSLASEAEVRTLLGKPVTIWLRNDIEAVRRPLHGYIRRLTRLTVDPRGYRRWRAEVAPWLWFLTRSVDCRIYQNLTIPEILRSVFDDHGLSHYEFRLPGQYEKLVFCVQYRESVFAFVSRLMEHVGIFYWFEHHQDRHVLVLADANNMASYTQPRQVTLSLRPDLGEIQELEHDYAFLTGNWALDDFDFEVPTKTLRTHEPTTLDVAPMKRFEIFDYPGSFMERDHGSRLTRLRMEGEEARHHQVSGAGSYVGFNPGKRFTLTATETEGGEKPATYLLTEVRHSARDSSYFSTEADPATYSNRFICIPVGVQFRPERLTPKPIVQGPQTATVVGPAGENIHTDQYGRVRLLFHWDRRGKRDEHASCWIRVSQVSAGSHWGSLAIPHVGQEVMVAFLEGDPDRPIVIGHMHNGSNMPPLNLPADKNKTILRDHADNKIIMEGRPGGQHLTMVSPRAVNLIAARPPARPLSADINFGTGGSIQGASPFQDPPALSDLQSLLTALSGSKPSDPTKDIQLVPGQSSGTPATGTPGQPGYQPAVPAVPAFADSVSLQDINTIAERKINTLSGDNTNAWIGNEMNTWVGGDLNQEVLGKTDTLAHGDTTNTYRSQVTDNFDALHEENSTIHNEFTALHIEDVGAHVETTLAHIEFTPLMHIEESSGIHVEFHWEPVHSDLSPTTAYDGTYLAYALQTQAYALNATGECVINATGELLLMGIGGTQITALGQMMIQAPKIMMSSANIQVTAPMIMLG